MHYIGMAAMQMDATIQYNPLLFAASILIAVVASSGALWLAFRMRTDNPQEWFYQKVASAVVLGSAISGMHYTGMLAASYRMLDNMPHGTEILPMVGPYTLRGVLTVASVFLALALFLLVAQASEERQKALAAALESKRRFLATFEQAAVGIAEVGLGGEWLKLNRKYCEILGYSQEELFGKTFQDVTHPDDLEADIRLHQKLLSHEIEQYPLEKRYIRKDGSLIWVKLSVSLVEDEQHNPL
jgi:PAS domain S-box-containing protein